MVSPVGLVTSNKDGPDRTGPTLTYMHARVRARAGANASINNREFMNEGD
jgi:hypothetical protein